jgi:hypothetical protein
MKNLFSFFIFLFLILSLSCEKNKKEIIKKDIPETQAILDEYALKDLILIKKANRLSEGLDSGKIDLKRFNKEIKVIKEELLKNKESVNVLEREMVRLKEIERNVNDKK